jgi:hypothetical protein
MKIFQLIAVLVLMSSNSCGNEPFDAANGRRSFVSGKIVDQQGKGIEGYGIQILSFGDIVGITSTDDKGNYEAAILEDIRGMSTLSIRPFKSDPAYTSFDLRYRYDVAQPTRSYEAIEITLKKQAIIKLKVENSTGDPFGTELIYNRASCSYVFENDALDSVMCYNIVNESVFGQSYRPYSVPLNSVFTVVITQNGVSTNYDYIIDQENYEILLII